MLKGGYLKWAVKGVMLAGASVWSVLQDLPPIDLLFWITKQTATSHMGSDFMAVVWAARNQL